MSARTDLSGRDLARVAAELLAVTVGAFAVVRFGLVPAVAPGLAWLAWVAAVVAGSAYAQWRLYHTELGERLRSSVEDAAGVEP